MNKLSVIGVFFLFSTLILAGCVQLAAKPGTGRAVFLITDAAANASAVTSVKITVGAVEAHSNTEGWVTVSSTPKTYDLLQLKAQGTNAVLADARLAAGTYQQLRLNISSVVVTDASGDHEAKLPSGELKIVGQLVVANETNASVASTATFDFIVDESLHVTGKGEYILAPVVKLETRENAEVEVESNGTARVRGGRVSTGVKVGMSVNGTVGVGIGIGRIENLVIEGSVIKVRVEGMKKTNVEFTNHIDAMLPEQDVFIESNASTSQVVRVEGAAGKDRVNLEKQVYASATVTAHDPFKVGPNPLGPFAKGKALGFTLAKWLYATGSGFYTVDGNQSELKLSFRNLIEGGVYTAWCSRLTYPPNPVIVDKPCGAADGSQNSFNASEKGNGEFSLKMPPLEASSKQTVSLVAIAYHSDNQTHGASAGDFGLNTHVQLFFILPVLAEATVGVGVGGSVGVGAGSGSVEGGAGASTGDGSVEGSVEIGVGIGS